MLSVSSSIILDVVILWSHLTELGDLFPSWLFFIWIGKGFLIYGSRTVWIPSLLVLFSQRQNIREGKTLRKFSLFALCFGIKGRRIRPLKRQAGTFWPCWVCLQAGDRESADISQSQYITVPGCVTASLVPSPFLEKSCFQASRLQCIEWWNSDNKLCICWASCLLHLQFWKALHFAP